MIDLHLHSLYSDGSQSVEDLLRQADDNDIALVALTDHDTTADFSAAKRLAEHFKVDVISGVEITTVKNNKVVHLLAHGVSEDNLPLIELLAHLREGRRKGVIQKLEQINQLFKTNNKQLVDTEDVLKTLTHFAYPTLAGYLVANKFCSTLQEAFGLLAGMKVRSDDVSTERAIEVVHQAGGYATLAHPFAPKISLRNISKEASELLSICRELKESGLDGIEVYTPAHKDEDIAFAEEVAKELDLFPNIGSDWHGPISNDDPQREFIPRYPIQYREAFLNIPENVVQDLIERFSKSSH